jgi:Domain of unknown function (DUF4407)
MQIPQVQAPPLGAVGRLLVRIAGGDPATLALCPERDRDILKQDAVLLIAVCLYQGLIYSSVLERTMSPSGKIRPELITLGIGLATMVLIMDVVMVMTPSWISAGEEALRRGGLSLEISWAKRVERWFFLGMRFSITIISAQLTGMLTGTLIFAADIQNLAHRDFLAANQSIIASATAKIDGEIARTTSALKAETEHAASLTAQIDTVRARVIDPSAADPRVRQALGDVGRLEAQKAKASAARAQAEAFASDELAGLKTNPGNSGQQGNGPVRAAALERVRHAVDDERRLDDELAAARQRLDALQRESARNSDAARHQADGQLPQFQNALATEQDEINKLQTRLAELTAGRDEAIQNLVTNDPNFRPEDHGFVAQLRAMQRITDGDPIALTLVLLIGAFAFFLEAAVICAKTFARVPTTYAALIARNCFLSDVAVAEEALEELCVRGAREDLNNPFSPFKPKEPRDPVIQAGLRPGNGETPIRRKRGRPPKSPPSSDPPTQ